MKTIVTILLLSVLSIGESRSFIEISARRLQFDYLNSFPASYNRYYGKWVAVTGGTVTGIEPREKSTERCDTNVMIDVQIVACALKRDTNWIYKNVHIGTPVTAVCIAGIVGPQNEVYLDNCIIAVPRRQALSGPLGAHRR